MIAEVPLPFGETVEVRPMAGHIGAEILGIDLSHDHCAEIYASILSSLHRYGVIFFRDQKLTTAEYVALAGHFGALEEHKTLPHEIGFPQASLLIKEEDHVTSIGDMWHTDHTYLGEPMFGTMLRAIEVPQFGGDTIFLNAAAAYEALPDAMKHMLKDLRALHSRTYLIKNPKYGAQFLKERPPASKELNAMAVHPVVRPHPVTGREVLFINPGYTVKFDGWSREQSAPLLKMLFEHCLQPEFQCRFRWQPGSIAFWDNGQTWHYAINDYHGKRRAMQRIVIS